MGAYGHSTSLYAKASAGRSDQQLAQPYSEICTAPKLFVKIHPHASLNFHKIWLPEVKVEREQQYLCGPVHVQGMEFTRSICRFMHFPPSELAALDTLDREKVNLYIHQTQAIHWANAWQPGNSWRHNQGVSWHQSIMCDTPPPPPSTAATAASSNQPVPLLAPPATRGAPLPCNLNVGAYANQLHDQSRVLS